MNILFSYNNKEESPFLREQLLLINRNITFDKTKIPNLIIIIPDNIFCESFYTDNNRGIVNSYNYAIQFNIPLFMIYDNSLDQIVIPILRITDDNLYCFDYNFSEEYTKENKSNFFTILRTKINNISLNDDILLL